MRSIYRQFGITDKVLDYAAPVLRGLEERFRQIDETAEYNQLRIIKAMQEAHIGEASLKGTTGYGYDDIGREGLEKVYALYLYRQVDLLPDSTFDFEGIRAALIKDPSIRLVTIQRSKGYQDRRTLSVQKIGEAISMIKKIRPDVICMVDNCYGEFVDVTEPSDVGADMIVGSLIKNPGGGLAPIGGYIAGTAECVENAAVRLTSPGLGKEVGATLDVLPSFFQGFFMGPSVTAAALKGRDTCRRISMNPSASRCFPTARRRGTISFRPSLSGRRKA